MNSFDALILIVAIAAGFGGYRLGLVARAASWFGMIVGITLAARLVPGLLERLEGADPARLLLTASGILIGGAFLGQALGLVVGARLHYALPLGRARDVDRVAGGVAGVLGVLVAVWLITPAMASVPGLSARLARNSTITRTIEGIFPRPPDALRSLERLVGTDLPSVLDSFEPAPDVGPPPEGSGLTEAAAEAIAASTVKVEAFACGRIQDGSGALVQTPSGPFVVTNAHVVAGADEVFVERHPDGAALGAELVAFDPNRDVAVLRVPDLEREPLPIGDIAEGGVGAVFGHPGGGELELSPFQVGREVTASGRDIYDAARTERQVFFLAAALAPGDSGGALVDAGGNVVGVAFAIAPDDPNVAFALTIEEVLAVLSGDLSRAVGAGPCLR